LINKFKSKSNLKTFQQIHYQKMSVDIVNLIESNPITRLNGNYQSKLVQKVKNNFSNYEQQLFVSSFYCYLNYNSKTDFVIDLDNVWKWLGFSQKDAAKRVLEKNFVPNKDYNVLLHKPVEQKKTFLNPEVGEAKKDTRGGHNRETIMLNVETFKKFCLKAGTKKADEIHDYFLKLEELLHETLQEESADLKLQLEQKATQLEQKETQLENTKIALQDQKVQSMNEKSSLLEETLISQFPINTQCIYLGMIDNKSLGRPNSKMYHEDLVKFGQTNNLAERVTQHKKTFTNFRLIAAFKVKNKIEIENAMKRHPVLQKRIRSVMIKDINYRELLATDEAQFTIENILEQVKQIIKENEYNVENYNLLVEKNYDLEEQLRAAHRAMKEKEDENEKLKAGLKNFQPDTTDDSKNKIASNYAFCKYGYYLYAFESSPMRFKCSIVRQKDYEILQTNLKQLHADGEMRYNVKVNYPLSEKIMSFILKTSLTCVGNNNYEGTFETIKKTLDVTLKLEGLLMTHSKDLDRLEDILDCNNVVLKSAEAVDPEVPQVRKAKRSIDQINVETGVVIKTYESIEAAGRSLGLTTGTAVGIALREKRVCKGFIWRYSGVSKEDQYSDQPVVKVCCSTGKRFHFNTIADAAKDCNISAPGLRMRILSDVHVNKHHWVFNKSSTHYV
jgi:hypothetical protein